MLQRRAHRLVLGLAVPVIALVPACAEVSGGSAAPDDGLSREAIEAAGAVAEVVGS